MFVLRVASTCILLAGSAAGFSVSKHSSPVRTTTTTSELAVSSRQQFSFQDEFDANFVMARARSCAYEDTCDVEEASHYLQNIVQVQGACDGGTLSGTEICENQDIVADIVAHLRMKIERGSSGLAASLPVYREVPLGITMGSCMITILLFGIILSRVSGWDVASAGDEPLPFTMEEWKWAIQGGYVDTMVHHYIKNGGL